MTIFAYAAEPGSRFEEALRLLRSWVATVDHAGPAHAADQSRVQSVSCYCRRERELRFEDSSDEFPGRRRSHSVIPVASDPTMGSAGARPFESDGGR